MNQPDVRSNANVLAKPARRFPVIRYLSYLATPWLVRVGATPNQITVASIALGIAGVSCFLAPESVWRVCGGVLLVLSYVLDNSDGEVARITGRSSAFGARLDDFGDWLVHASFFAVLGIAVGRSSAHEVWLWLGWIAAAGATVNYAMTLVRAPVGDEDETSESGECLPETAAEWAVYAIRELFRADFCFLVLALALADMLWLLLPAAALGAQAYWLMGLIGKARRYHV